MLNFFKRIRRRLFDEGNLKKYFFYAIGEILLVVLGILIALQINNANQQKQERSYELKMLNEIRNDLVNDIQIYKGLLGWVKCSEFASQKLLKAYGTNNDSLVVQYFPFMLSANWVTYLSRHGAYEALKSSGLDKISNDTLRTGLQALYEYEHDRLEKGMEYNKKWKNQLIEQIKEELIGSELKEDNQGTRFFVTVANQENLMKDSRLLKLIEIIQHKNNYSKDCLQELISLSESMLQQLNRELEGTFPTVFIGSAAIHSVGLLGSVIEGGWDTDLDMKDEDGDGIYTIETNLRNGEVKFRANDTWEINWGNVEPDLSFPIGASYQDGGNIKVKEGFYRISLDSYNGFYQFEKLE